jgi:hypothetical protein
VRAIKTTTISILAVGLLAGSAVGVTAQDEPSVEATEVTGQVTFGQPIAMPDPVETPDGIVVREGVAAPQTWDTSDPRLTGEGTYTVNVTGIPDCCAIQAEAYELSNDGGSWVGDGRSISPESGRHGFVALSGRDGYEGLTAYAVTEVAADGSGWDITGMIFPSEMPEIPEPYVAE